MKTKLFLITLVSIFLSCSTSKEQMYWVNSIKVNCQDKDSLCLQISKNEDFNKLEWETISVPIQNFVFEEGFFKKICVKEILSEKEIVPSQYIMIKELEKQQDSTFLIHGTWVLQQIKGQVPDTQDIPTMTIQLHDKKIYGHAGCNHYFGTITELTHQNIQFDQMGSTRKMCPEDRIEMLYLSTLHQIHSYQIRNQQLVFSDDTGKEILTFRAEK